jgi:hypothetical protein
MEAKQDKAAEIRELHERYKMLTGLVVPLDMHREYLWMEFLRRGLTGQDLAVVVRAIRRGVAEGSRNRGALRFHNLIGQIDYFEEELAEAASQTRKSEVRSPKSEILRATGREGQSAKAEVRSVGSVAAVVTSDPVKAEKALEELRKLKGSL